MGKQNTKDKVWNFIFSVLYVLIAIGLYMILEAYNTIYMDVPTFDMIIIVLALFRLTRLFVYDKIMVFIRDFLGGYKSSGIRKTLHELIICPWCASVWLTPFVLAGYFMWSFFWFFLVILAVSGVVTVIQIGANLLGWSAQRQKLLCQEMEK